VEAGHIVIEEKDCDTMAQLSWFLIRPNAVMMSLPVEYRWEFTRRHPYYLQFWRAAWQHHEMPSSSPKEKLLEECAILVLAGIGVSQAMAPPDPRLGPEALGTHDLGAAWIGGAVAPVTNRGLAGMLISSLPASERMRLGRLLTESAEYDSNNSEQMLGIYARLAQWTEAVWDNPPQAPIISINLESPQRAIVAAVEELTREWKEDRAIPEHRRRDDKLNDYLAVWDRREGWEDGQYDVRQERTFPAIARELGLSVPTLTSQYRRAFHQLSGYQYTPELWIRLMGSLKLPQLPSEPEARPLLLRRPWRSPNTRPVTEAVLLPGRKDFDRSDFLAATGVTESQIALTDLALDVQTLMDCHLSDDAILAKLELPPGLPIRELLAYLRELHMQD
jgi:hypothetical protein